MHRCDRLMWLRGSLAGKLVVLVLLAAGYVGLYCGVPPRHRVEPYWGEAGANWLGQAPALAILHAVAILSLLYLVRYFITTRSQSVTSAWLWYSILLAALLPGVWLLVAFDWDNEAVAPIANWVGTPIVLFVVPTASMCFDLTTGTRLPPRWYLARSAFELIALIPIWTALWVFCEFFVLGWVGP
jgi:hypothetical protein